MVENSELQVADGSLVAVRTGWRALLQDLDEITRVLAGQLPYYYRPPRAIGQDFASGHNALDLVVDLVVRLPTKESFRRSHAGEVIASIYLEDLLGFKRLYSKLALTTTEDENVHKMDGLFVRVVDSNAEFVAVEAKTSVLPTEATRFSGHRHGILKAMLDSLGGYAERDLRFDLTLARDQLDHGDFSREEQRLISSGLRPPGPRSLQYMGLATINEQTIDPKDDAFILTAPCDRDFDFHEITVPDVAALADAAYAQWGEVREAADVRRPDS